MHLFRSVNLGGYIQQNQHRNDSEAVLCCEVFVVYDQLIFKAKEQVTSHIDIILISSSFQLHIECI